MKIITLLVVTTTISVINCQSAVNPPPTSTSVKEPEIPILLRISDTLSAHARLVIGLHVLAESIKPKSDMTDLKGFLNINDSLFSDLMDADVKEAERVVKELEDMKHHMFDSGPYLEKIKNLEELQRKIERAAPLPSKEEKSQMYLEMDEWMAVEKINSKLLKNVTEHAGFVNNSIGIPTERKNISGYIRLEFSDPNAQKKITNATSAIFNFPFLLEEAMKRFPVLLHTENFDQVFSSIKTLAHFTDDIEKVAITVTDTQDASKLKHLVSKSSGFNKASKLSKTLLILSDPEKRNSAEGRRWAGAFPNQFLDLDMLRRDLDGSFLKESLTKPLPGHWKEWMSGGKDLAVLRHVLRPLFELKETVHDVWTGVKAATSSSMKDAMLKISPLLDLISAAEYAESNPNITWDSMDNITAKLKEFKEAHDNVTAGVSKYGEIVKNITSLKATDCFKQSSIISEEAASLVEMDTAQEYKESEEKLKSLQKCFSDVAGALKTIVVQFQEVAVSFKSIPRFKELTEEAQPLLTKAIETFKRKMAEKKELVSRFKFALNFVKEYQETVKSEAVFSEYVDHVTQLKAALEKGFATLETGKKNQTRLCERFYNQVILLNDEIGSKDKLMVGSVLFKLFNDFLEKRDNFHNFFQSGARLQKELARNSSLRFYQQKMDGFNSMKIRLEKMEKVVLARKEYYGPFQLEEVFEARRLVESLADIPNPEIRVSEWKELTEELEQGFPGLLEFNKTLHGIFDLDFAVHQKKVKDAYRTYFKLKWFHSTIVAIEEVPVPTWWMRNYHIVRYGGFVVFTIVAYLVVFFGSLYWFKRQEQEDKMKEEQEEYEYYERKAQRMKEGEDSEEEEFIRQFVMYKLQTERR